MTTDTTLRAFAAMERRLKELDAKYAIYKQAGYRPVWGRAEDVRRTTLNRVVAEKPTD